jgi:hypothetical protein
MQTNRRTVLKGAGAVVASKFVCTPVAIALDAVPRMSCGCVNPHPEYDEFPSCCVHDKDGKRWDSYTFEDVAKASNAEIEVQTSDTEWSCYCSRCDQYRDNQFPVGTRCVWEQTSYEYNEHECRCEHSYREDFINCATTDWIAMVKEDERRGFA